MNYKGLLFALSFVLSFSALVAQPTFSFDSGTGNPGTSFTTDVTVDDFDDILSVQFSIRWDPAVLEFVQTTNLATDLPGLIPGNIGDFASNTDDGIITFSWLEPNLNSASLDDGSVLFSIEFTAIGAPCDSTQLFFGEEPLASEVIDSNEDDIGLMVDEGSFAIPGTDCEGNMSGDLSFIVDDMDAPAGTNVCIPVKVEGFVDINAMQFTINFDETVLQYTGVGSAGELAGFTSGNIGAVGADEGTLTCVWFDQNVDGETVADGTTIFDLCFDVIGNIGDMSDISFGGTPLPIMINDVDGALVPAFFDEGKITVVEVATDPVEFFISDVTACPSDVVEVPILVSNFTDIASFQFTVRYDDAVLNYSDILYPDAVLAGLNDGSFNTPLSDAITCVWFLPGTEPESLNDNDTLFIIEFTVVGAEGTNSFVRLSDTPLEKEVTAGDPAVVVACESEDGSVSVNCGLSCQLDMIEDAMCGGDGSGSIFISVLGGSGDFSFAWSNGAVSEDLIAVAPDEYSVTVTDNQNNTTTTCGPFEIGEEFGISSATEVTGLACNTTNTGEIDLVICGDATEIRWTKDGTFFSVQEDLLGLEAGTYEVTVRNAVGETFTMSYDIVNEGGVSLDAVTITPESSAGSDGAISVTLSGGVEPYRFAWSNGETTQNISGLSADCYSLTVTDAEDCESVFTDLCVANNGLIVDIETSDNGGFAVRCKGEANGSITLTPQNGVGPYTYEWSNPDLMGSMVTDLPAGAYGVTVTDSEDLTYVDVINVTEPDEIEVTIDVECASGEEEADGAFIAQVSGGVGPYSYVWNNDVSETDDRLDGQLPGTRASLEVIDANGCDANIPASSSPEMCIDGGACFTGREVITPNGDDLNDVLRIACLSSTDNRLGIYNRVGERVWSMQNYDNTWMGTNQVGEDLEDGVYFWVLSVFGSDNRETIYRGHVTILRTLD